MTTDCVRPWKGKDFNHWLVEEYFKHGSVDEVFRFHSYDVPISYAQYQKILDSWGIVKTAGPNNKISEMITFLAKMVEEEIPLEKLYKKMPSSFMTSAVTLYRILSYIKEGITRRMGTGLIISPYNDDKKILIGKDISIPRFELGKEYGMYSLPMGFSRKRDSRENAILRILQNEVFTDIAINKNMPDVIPVRPKPFLYLDIADVRVEVFHIQLPKKYSDLKFYSSYKLSNFTFIDTKKIKNFNFKFRAGVTEAIEAYLKYQSLRERNLSFNPLQIKSRINYHFANQPMD